MLQLNDVLSLGLHRVWKRTAVKWCGAATGQTVLDVCCGSGDLALRLAQAVGIDGKVQTCGTRVSVHLILALAATVQWYCCCMVVIDPRCAMDPTACWSCMQVVGLDFAQEMLDDAAQRDLKLPAYWDRAPIDWVQVAL